MLPALGFAAAGAACGSAAADTVLAEAFWTAIRNPDWIGPFSWAAAGAAAIAMRHAPATHTPARELTGRIIIARTSSQQAGAAPLAVTTFWTRNHMAGSPTHQRRHTVPARATCKTGSTRTSIDSAGFLDLFAKPLDLKWQHVNGRTITYGTGENQTLM
jgi:hypothetical protein